MYMYFQYILSYFHSLKELGQVTHVLHGTPNTRYYYYHCHLYFILDYFYLALLESGKITYLVRSNM